MRSRELCLSGQITGGDHINLSHEHCVCCLECTLGVQLDRDVPPTNITFVTPGQPEASSFVHFPQWRSVQESMVGGVL